MEEIITYVGLDVHKYSIVIALAEGKREGEVRFYGTIENRISALDSVIRKLQSRGKVEDEAMRDLTRAREDAKVPVTDGRVTACGDMKALPCEVPRERSARGGGSPPTSYLWGPFSGNRPLELHAHGFDQKEVPRQRFSQRTCSIR